MVARALGDLAEEGGLPKTLFTQAAAQLDFRFGVQLSTPVQSEAKHVEQGQMVLGDTHKPQLMESVGQFHFRQDVERKTTNSFSQYLGTSSAAPMSKEDTINELARKLNHDSGGKMSIAESRAEATERYEKKEAEVAHDMQASAPKGTTIYGTDPGEIAKNLGDTQRRQGETGEQYSERRHRMDEIKHITDPDRRKEALGKYVSEQLGDTYLPVLFRRADGQHGTLAYVLSGVNIANNNSADVKGSDGATKDPGSYYSVLPPFFGFSADQNNIYTTWFGKSENGLIETSSVYQFSVNGDNEEQIKLNVTPSSGGDPPQITVFDGANTGTYGPYELHLDNANQGSSVTLTSDGTPELILDDGANKAELKSTELFIYNQTGVQALVTSEGDGEITITGSGGNDWGSLTPSALEISSGSGANVYIDVPSTGGSASWKPIAVCVNGVQMTMMVLGTDPY
jgi:hypothetical protein